MDLDTAIVPNVFGLRAFDPREPVARMLPGDFGNSVRVLVPDATTQPMGFHDSILEDVVGTQDDRARRIVPSDVTSLRRWWTAVLFETMHKRQADMEYLHRACRQRFDSEFGGRRTGTCPYCGVYILSNLSRHVMDLHLELVNCGGVRWSGALSGRGL